MKSSTMKIEMFSVTQDPCISVEEGKTTRYEARTTRVKRHTSATCTAGSLKHVAAVAVKSIICLAELPTFNLLDQIVQRLFTLEASTIYPPSARDATLILESSMLPCRNTAWLGT